MAGGCDFNPPNHEEFRILCIKMHGNAKAIASKLNISPNTLYVYFRKDPKAKEILNEIRGYNTFTDLDLAEYVNRYNMSQVTENPAIAQRASEFTLRYKGKERGWVESDNKDASNQEDDNINLSDIILKQQNEIRKLKELLKGQITDDVQRQTSPELLRSDEEA